MELPPFYRNTNRGFEKYSKLLKVIQVPRAELGFNKGEDLTMCSIIRFSCLYPGRRQACALKPMLHRDIPVKRGEDKQHWNRNRPGR